MFCPPHKELDLKAFPASSGKSPARKFKMMASLLVSCIICTGGVHYRVAGMGIVQQLLPKNPV